MSTEVALLRAIRDEPAEDTPRLIYADYLDEEGNPARAEFIRLQVARDQLPAFDPERAPLEDREHELLSEHECAWLGVPHDDMQGFTEWGWDRGFVNEVAASPDFMNGPGNDLCAAHGVRRWRVMLIGNAFREDLNEAGQRGWANRLEAVDLRGWYPEIGMCSGFLSKSHLARLRELDLTGRGPYESLLMSLEFAPFRNQLKVLSCGSAGYEDGRLDPVAFVQALGAACKLTDLSLPATQPTTDELIEMLAAPAFADLTALDISNNQLEPRAWQAFHVAKFKLRELDISGTGLADELDRLIALPALRELRRLHLNRSANTAEGISALAASAFWAHAEEFRMQQGVGWNAGYDNYDDEFDEPAFDPAPDAAPVSLDPLFAAQGSPNLRILDLSGNNLRDAGVARLCAAPWASSLAYLDLSQNYLTDEALRTLATSGKFRSLHTLHLNGNSVYHLPDAQGNESLTDAGLKALANCPDFANLRVLSVSGTRITAEGLEAILNSPHWKLSAVRIAHCQLRRRAVDVLVASPGLSRLQVLDLSGNDELGLSGLAPLAECEYLSPQTELNVRGVGDDNSKVRQALEARLGRRFSL